MPITVLIQIFCPFVVIVVHAIVIDDPPYGSRGDVGCPAQCDEQSREVRRWTTYLVLATSAATIVHLLVWSLWNGPEGNITWVFFFVYVVPVLTLGLARLVRKGQEDSSSA